MVNQVNILTCLGLRILILSWHSGCIHFDYKNFKINDVDIFIFMDYMALTYFLKNSHEYTEKNIFIICDEKTWNYSWVNIEEDSIIQNSFNFQNIYDQWEMKYTKIVDGQVISISSNFGDLNILYSQSKYFISCGLTKFYLVKLINDDYNDNGLYAHNIQLPSIYSSYPELVIKILNSSKKINIINSNCSGYIFKIIEEMIISEKAQKFVIFSPLAKKSFVSFISMSGYFSDRNSKQEHIFQELISDGSIILISDFQSLISSNLVKCNSNILFFTSNSWTKYLEKYLSYNNINYGIFSTIFNEELEKIQNVEINSKLSLFLLPITISSSIASKIFPDQDSIHVIKNVSLKKEEYYSNFILHGTDNTSVTKHHINSIRSPFHTIDNLRSHKIYTIKILKNSSPFNWEIFLPHYNINISPKSETQILITSLNTITNPISIELSEIFTNSFDKSITISY